MLVLVASRFGKAHARAFTGSAHMARRTPEASVVAETTLTPETTPVATETPFGAEAALAPACAMTWRRMATTPAATALVAELIHRLARLQTGNGLGVDFLLAEGFDFTDLAAIAEFGHGHGQPLTPGPARAAYAVGVVLGFHGQTEVEHMGDGGHVDATRGHVGGHQYLHLAVAQGHQAAVAQPLAQGTVQSHGGKADLLQVGGQGIAFDLRAGKHDGLVDGGVTQPVVQQLALVLRAVAPVEALLDVDVLVLRGVDLHLLRAAHDAGGQCLDAGGKGGAEHHGLATGGGEPVDFGQVVREAEVEHAVGFIDDQELHFIEFDLAAALQVQQATRRGHHQIGVLQLGNLHLVGHAAHHVGNAQAAAVLDEVDRVVRHLLRQFTGRAQHQCARHGGLEVARQQWVFALRTLGFGLASGQGFGHLALPIGAFFGFMGLLLLQQGVQHREQKSRSLAAAGLARDHQVGVGLRFDADLHRLGNGGLLD